jgi:hypothetical protein
MNNISDELDWKGGAWPGKLEEFLREADNVIGALLRDIEDYGAPALIAKNWAAEYKRKRAKVAPAPQLSMSMFASIADYRTAVLAQKLHAPLPARMNDKMRAFIEGMSVSVDVSTGEHDAGHRYFGTVTEVMDDLDDKHGVTLLVQDAEPNFTRPVLPEDTLDRLLIGKATEGDQMLAYNVLTTLPKGKP